MSRQFSGRRLREARKSRGLPVERVALAVERTAYTINEYEAGRAAPSARTLGRLADVLRCRVDDLFEVVASE
jgi:transcriptional regulator with XRE-family HTH domain